MPTRILLSSEQRIRLFAIPTDTAEMTRHYVLNADDLALVGARRCGGNRLGFAVQLCALRHPGRVPDPSESPPAQMLAFIAGQIGVDPALFGEYARRAETRREHVLEPQRLLRLRASVSRTGGRLFGSARRRHGPRIAVNLSSRLGSHQMMSSP